MMGELDLYLRLERLMVDLDRASDPMSDRVRDLMDSVWYRLSAEDLTLLDSRGHVNPAGLFPVRLPLPTKVSLPVATIVGQRFEAPVGWRAPDDWKRAA